MASGPTYSVTSGSDFSTDGKSTVTDSTNTLDLYYKHRQCNIIPKLTISNNPYKHLVHWEASIAYNQPFYEQAGIVAYQNNTNRLNNSGQIKSLDAYNTVTTFGGNKITAAPFAYSGLSVEITLGIAVTKLRLGL